MNVIISLNRLSRTTFLCDFKFMSMNMSVPSEANTGYRTCLLALVASPNIGTALGVLVAKRRRERATTPARANLHDVHRLGLVKS